MGKVTIHGWQKDASNAATPTGPVTLRAGLGRFAATQEEQAEFARKHPGEVVIRFGDGRTHSGGGVALRPEPAPFRQSPSCSLALHSGQRSFGFAGLSRRS